MKKFFALVLTLMCFVAVALCISCGGDKDGNDHTSDSVSVDDGSRGDSSGTDSSDNSSGEDSSSDKPDETALKEFDKNVVFNDGTYIYDGQEKCIFVVGAPDGAEIEYVDNRKTDAGEYNATAKITKDGYKPKTLTATLTIEKAEIIGVTFIGAEYVYDGEQKSITAVGIPEGAEVTYGNNKGVDAGVYHASATISKKNYKTKTLNADLTITRADIAGITFEDTSAEYDTFSHEIEIIGDIPQGVTVRTTYNGAETTGVTEVGEYTVVLTITGKNYNTFTKTATLKITSTEERLFSAVYSGGIYFQNNLDDNKLYLYNNGLSKINNDAPEYLTVYNGKLYYTSKALFGSAIKSYTDGDDSASVFTNVAGEYIVCDGTYLYYAKNSLIDTNDTNGIYRVSLTGDGTVPQRIVKNKAAYLTIVGNDIYYSNLGDGKKLYKVPKNAAEAEDGTKVRNGDYADESVEYIIADGNMLYFNSVKKVVGVGVAAAVRKFDTVSGSEVKLTTDSGKYLNVIGGYIYYVNNDKITSELFGDGIYRISVAIASDNNKAGEKVLSADNGNGYSSLASDGKNLYYYKLNDKHFYGYSLSTKTETDLMNGFVPPEPVMKIACYAETKIYNGEIYFINPYGDGMLYKYNPVAKRVNKVLEDRVSDVYFYRGYMYYSTCIATNYALFRMDLKTKESEKISSNRCDKLIFDGDTIYYIKVGSKYDNDIHKMDLDGKNPTRLLDKSLWVSNLEKVGGSLYFATNNVLGKSVYKYDIATGQATDLKKTSTFVTVSGGRLYYYDSNKDRLMSCDLNGGDEKMLVDSVKINDMIVDSGKIYYSDTKSGKLYAYNLTTAKTSVIAQTCADGMSVGDGKLYYIGAAVNYQNDYPFLSGGDGRLYCYDGTDVTGLA